MGFRLARNASNQTISFSPPTTVKFGTAFSANATASSGLPVSLASSNSSVVKVAAGRIQIVGTGTTRITASQQGDMHWNAASPVVRTVTVVKGDQKIVFANPGNKKFRKGAKFTLAATVNSKLPITFTSSNPSVVSIQGRTATIRGRGEVRITARQGGNKNWNAAPAVGRSFRIQ
jgi:Ethanolamine utilization protein EutJ (predicted chaperonin)